VQSGGKRKRPKKKVAKNGIIRKKKWSMGGETENKGGKKEARSKCV